MALNLRRFIERAPFLVEDKYAFVEKEEQTEKEETRCKNWQIESLLFCLLFFAFFLLLFSLFLS
jgi:hypothetical protein